MKSMYNAEFVAEYSDLAKESIEDRTKALVVRMAKRSKTPRLAYWPDGVVLTENGESKFFTWNEWDERGEPQ